jgi:hypothetical protein
MKKKITLDCLSGKHEYILEEIQLLPVTCNKLKQKMYVICNRYLNNREGVILAF